MPIAATNNYNMPAEWAPHVRTWLSWPFNLETWPRNGIYEAMLPQYAFLVGTIARFEPVHINVADATMEHAALQVLETANIDTANVHFHHFPTNDSWCRDHGPIFVKNHLGQKNALKWLYNAWGGKYPPFDLDNQIPFHIANYCKVPIVETGIIMEGGSLEVNGEGTVITTTSCLLNPNRNPHLNLTEISAYLETYIGAKHIIWLHDGIVGDDTDGHIDDITRFVNKDTIVTAIEDNASDANYAILKDNLKALQKSTNQDGKPLNIIELPMPAPNYLDGIRLPASYANFLIVNGGVLVPIFNDKNDEQALNILQKAFPDRLVVGIPCSHIVWGLGTVHCLSQQEPL